MNGRTFNAKDPTDFVRGFAEQGEPDAIREMDERHETFMRPTPRLATENGEHVLRQHERESASDDPPKKSEEKRIHVTSSDVIEVARQYRGQFNWDAIPLEPHGKKPIGAWGDRPPIEYGDIPKFFGNGENVGVRLGVAPSNVFDIDCDARVFAEIASHDLILSTLPCFGRKSAPRSHRIVQCDDATSEQRRITKFALPASAAAHPRIKLLPHGLCLAELRGYGQTMFPPSQHPSRERVQWSEPLGATIPKLKYELVDGRVRLNVFLALCVICYPTIGARHSFCQALAGALLRHLRPQYKDDESDLIRTVDGLVFMVGEMARGGNSHRQHHAANTLAKIRGNAKASGLPTVIKLMGFDKAVLDAVRGWLGSEHDERAHIPVVLTKNGAWSDPRMSEVIDAAEQALIEMDAGLYERKGSIVELIRLEKSTPTTAPVRIQKGTPLIHEMDDHYLHEQFNKCAFWYATTKYGVAQVRPPMDIVRYYHRGRTGHRHLPELVGIMPCPCMDPATGRLIQEEGYDEESGLLLDFGGMKFDEVSADPTPEQVNAARETFAEPFKDFPFEDDASRSAAWAMCLTAFVRRLLPAAPFFAGDAPLAGSGKTLLANLPSWMMYGKRAVAMSQGATPEEDEKRLFAALIPGPAQILIDNVSHPVRGDAFNTVTTEEEWSSRDLGHSRNLTVRTNTLFVLTGNNLVVKGDARRRGLMWRLNAKVDRPDERKFDVDLKEWVPKNRGRLVHAGLTLMAGYYAARRAAPDGKLFRDRVGKEPDAFGEYREWSASVRGTLLWLAMSDPVASQEEVFKREPEGQELSAFIMAVAGHSNLVGIEWTAAELLSLIGDPGDNSKAVLDALQAALPGNVTARTVGHFLLKYMGRPIGGRCIKRGTKDTHTDAYQWSVGLVELDLVGGSI